MAKAIPIEERQRAIAVPTARRGASDSASRSAPAWCPRIVLVVLGAFYFLPLYWMVVNALKSTEELGALPADLVPARPRVVQFLAGGRRLPVLDVSSGTRPSSPC